MNNNDNSNNKNDKSINNNDNDNSITSFKDLWTDILKTEKYCSCDKAC